VAHHYYRSCRHRRHRRADVQATGDELSDGRQRNEIKEDSQQWRARVRLNSECSMEHLSANVHARSGERRAAGAHDENEMQ
jgi:hypothetical protein